MANTVAAVETSVNIHLPTPYNVQFTIEMGIPLKEFSTKEAKNPWKPICKVEESFGFSGKNTRICKIYVGDRAKSLPKKTRSMFPAFVEVKLLETKNIETKDRLNDFVKSLDPSFFEVVKLDDQVKEKVNAHNTPLILVDCRRLGGNQIHSHIIVKSSPPVLISGRGEVDLNSIRILRPPGVETLTDQKINRDK